MTHKVGHSILERYSSGTTRNVATTYQDEPEPVKEKHTNIDDDSDTEDTDNSLADFMKIKKGMRRSWEFCNLVMFIGTAVFFIFLMDIGVKIALKNQNK